MFGGLRVSTSSANLPLTYQFQIDRLLAALDYHFAFLRSASEGYLRQLSEASEELQGRFKVRQWEDAARITKSRLSIGLDWDPVSASKRDPLERRALTPTDLDGLEARTRLWNSVDIDNAGRALEGLIGRDIREINIGPDKQGSLGER